jgi:GTPase SAR1 family protein
MVMIGDGMAGKTSFIRSLTENKATLTRPNERTRVLEVSSLSVKNGREFVIFDVFGKMLILIQRSDPPTPLISSPLSLTLPPLQPARSSFVLSFSFP